MMRGRDGKGPPSTDLLVCFPSRAHLSLMPKPICSPARPSDSSSSSFHRRRRSHHQLRHSGNRGGGGGHGSPLMWAAAKAKHNNNNNRNNNNNSDGSEPSSPKVTCAGQIKVRSTSKQASSCKNWQSVMEEIERMHNKKKRPAWMEALGFKKEVMQFLTCLRNISFDFRCFGSIPAVEISSDDDEEEEEDDYEYEDRNHRRKSGGGGGGGESGSSGGAVFSKWFMILQEENLSKEVTKNVTRPLPDEAAAAEVVPPANALLLMRCRSAPAKSWLEEREEEERERKEEERERKEEVKKKKEEEEVEEANYCEFAVEIGKEKWIQERICRSRSWKR